MKQLWLIPPPKPARFTRAYIRAYVRAQLVGFATRQKLRAEERARKNARYALPRRGRGAAC